MAWWPVCLRKTQKSQCLIWSSKYFCVCEEKAISSCHARVAEHKLWWHIWLKIWFFYACFLLIYAVAEICLTVFPYLRPFFEICGFYINFLSSLAVFAQLLSQPLPSLATQQSPMLGYEFVCVCTCVSIRSDVRLHKDDVDICFSKTLNSCKVPQIRYASVERLLERLTDLRFLSIDFLNTFLHTYRIFTTATVVMDKLADIYKKPFSSIPIRSYHSHMQISIHKHRLKADSVHVHCYRADWSAS